MNNFSYKHISDPVYKTIGLSELETEIIDTPVFQRLRRVKHLGLVSLVYPGADFSRFDHSLGVCHIMGRILFAIKNANQEILGDEKEIQKYRLAGLLHDIGHYPFSHPMEEAIKEFSAESSLEPKGTDKEPSNNGEQTETEFMKHEKVGEEILRLDPDLEKIFCKYKYEPEEISGIFMGSAELSYGNLVKSDLDADRIDYLLRTAQHTGVPYGLIDIDYLISQMVLDKKRNRASLQKRALRSAEHLLLCRHFVYQQTIFHKTVAGFESLLRDISKALLQRKLIYFSRTDIEQAIEKRKWCYLDDVYVQGKIRALKEELIDDEILRLKINSILDRKPVSLVYEWEEFASREAQESFIKEKKLAEIHKKEASERYGIDESLWHVWDKKVSITNLASHMKVSEKRDDDEILESVHLYDPDKNNSEPIMNNTRSLMNIMADHTLYIVRVYVLFPEDKMNLKSEIKEFFIQELS